jgi:hypothetical protein
VQNADAPPAMAFEVRAPDELNKLQFKKFGKNPTWGYRRRTERRTDGELRNHDTWGTCLTCVRLRRTPGRAGARSPRSRPGSLV